VGEPAQPSQIEGSHRLDFAPRQRELDAPFRHEEDAETSRELASLPQRHVRHGALAIEPAAGDAHATDESLTHERASRRARRWALA